MRFIIWLYVTFSSGDCRYERVSIKSDSDSLHIQSHSLEYHLKLEKRNEPHLVMSQDSVMYAVKGGPDPAGYILFLTNIKERKTIMLSSTKCQD